MDQYRYSKLEGKTIRLVVLLPGEFDQNIEIIIETADLETRVPRLHGTPQTRMLQNKENLPPVLSRESISFVEYLANTHYMYTPVLHMIHLTKGRECTDERDRVYGLLGLFPPDFQKRI